MKFSEINHIEELVKTFSNQPSFYSSKRFERFTIFNVFLWITIIFVLWETYRNELTATELCWFLGVWLGYAGYNTAINFREKKNKLDQWDKTSEP